MSTALLLMGVFAKVALGAFGGGLATIPFIHRELVELRPWLTEEMFGQTVALAQMTPGPVALNSATFVGYRMAGFWGSLGASMAVVATPLMVIVLLLWLISRASQRAQGRITAFEKGLRPAVAGLLFVAFCTLARPLLPAPSSLRAMLPKLALIALAFLCLALSRLRPFKAYPQLLILFAALMGLLLRGFLAAP